MKKIILLIISIITLILAGCTPGSELYEESKDIVSNDETLELLDTNQVVTLNSKLEVYEGKIKGTEVKALIRSINTFNSQELFPTKLKINDNANLNIVLENEKYTMGDVKDKEKYDISFNYGENAYITDININNIEEKENSKVEENIYADFNESGLISKYKISDDYSIDFNEWKQIDYNLVKLNEILENKNNIVESDGERIELKVELNSVEETYSKWVKEIKIYTNGNVYTIDGEDCSLCSIGIIDLDEKDEYKEIVICKVFGVDSSYEVYRIKKDGLELMHNSALLYNENTKQYIGGLAKVIEGVNPSPIFGYYLYENGDFKYIDKFPNGEEIFDENGKLNENFKKQIFTVNVEVSGLEISDDYKIDEIESNIDKNLYKMTSLAKAKIKFLDVHTINTDYGEETVYDIEIVENHTFTVYDENDNKKEVSIPAGTVIKGVISWSHSGGTFGNFIINMKDR